MFTSRYVLRGFVYTPLVYTHSLGVHPFTWCTPILLVYTHSLGVHPFCLLCWCTPILSTVLVYTHSVYCVGVHPFCLLCYAQIGLLGSCVLRLYHSLPTMSLLASSPVSITSSSLSTNHHLTLHYLHCDRRLQNHRKGRPMTNWGIP